ncbi:zinc-dependent alcohol dehydrogenase [Pseudonocardia cypriaca]|nr:alcohol dehydrogenase catalytic domain-containing protein [Pseudonocardia cypriaca]
MRALLLTGPRQWQVAELPVPVTEPGHCLVRVAYVGLCGTDLAFYDGSSGYLRDGLKRYPFVVGHEWSGTVVEVGTGVQGFAVGDPVAGHNVVTCDACDRCRSGRRLHCRNRTEIGVLGTCPGVASEYICMPAKTLLPLPASLDLRSAAVLEPATASAHAVARLGVREGDAVAVLGTGTLGLAAVQIARSTGARVTAVGVEAAGLALARELGAEAVLRPEEAEDDAYGAVIEATGAEPAIALAPRLVAPGGRLAFLGVPHGPVPAFPSAQLVMKNLEVHGVLSGIEQWDALLRLVVHGHVDLGALIDGVLPLASAGDALTALAGGRRSRPKVLLEIGGRSGSADLTEGAA